MFEKNPVKLYFKNAKSLWKLAFIFGVFAIAVGIGNGGFNIVPLILGIAIVVASVYYIRIHSKSWKPEMVDEYFSTIELVDPRPVEEGDKVFYFEGFSTIGLKYSAIFRKDKKDGIPRSSVYQKAQIIVRGTELIMDSNAVSVMEDNNSVEHFRYHADRISDCQIFEHVIPCWEIARDGKNVPGLFRQLAIFIDGDYDICFALRDEDVEKAEELKAEIDRMRDEIFA